jgi:hypothetical protein
MSKDYGPLNDYLKGRSTGPDTGAAPTPGSVQPVTSADSPSRVAQPTMGVSEGQRTNPRTGALLAKKVIPGTSIEIDYDPQTGGVFLDSGELENLSQVPDIKAKLEMLLSP